MIAAAALAGVLDTARPLRAKVPAMASSGTGGSVRWAAEPPRFLGADPVSRAFNLRHEDLVAHALNPDHAPAFLIPSRPLHEELDLGDKDISGTLSQAPRAGAAGRPSAPRSARDILATAPISARCEAREYAATLGVFA